MAANPMRSTDFRSIVEPILNEEFDGVYDQRADEYAQVFKTETGIPRNYHEEPVLYGFNNTIIEFYAVASEDICSITAGNAIDYSNRANQTSRAKGWPEPERSTSCRHKMSSFGLS